MNYLSVCSGIEAATVAWHPLGWKPVWFSEIEAFPRAVLDYHYPDIINQGDMTKYKAWPDESIDLLVGGTPCQSFSVAGLRKGLDDPRGNLMLTYLGIVKRYRPKWLVWENVPGVLSSNGGRDFGTFLGALGELGYGWSYRVLDAQHFGVPQRRRRVFVVGHTGGWQPAAAVLFERESLQRHPAKSREKKEDIAGTFTSRARSGGWTSSVDLAASGYMRAVPEQAQDAYDIQRLGQYGNGKISSTVAARDYKGATDLVIGAQVFQSKASTTNSMNPSLISPTLDKSKSDGVAVVLPIHDSATRYSGKRGGKSDGKGNGLGIGKAGDPCPTITKGDRHAVAFTQNSRDEVRLQGGDGSIAGALGANEGMKQRTYIETDMAVRRLTPVECERLQGFPDDYTRIPWRKKSIEQCPDGPRYKAIGNSMAVPVMQWIGRRIEQVDKIEVEN